MRSRGGEPEKQPFYDLQIETWFESGIALHLEDVTRKLRQVVPSHTTLAGKVPGPQVTKQPRDYA